VRVIDTVLEARGGSDLDYARAELDADGYVVVGDEAAFAESDRQLRDGKSARRGRGRGGEGRRYAGFAGAGVA